MPSMDSGTNVSRTNRGQREDVTSKGVLDLQDDIRTLKDAALRTSDSLVNEARKDQALPLELNSLIEQNRDLINKNSNLSFETKEILKSILTNDPDSAKVIHNSFFAELKNGLSAEQQLDINQTINRLLTEDLEVTAVGNNQEAIRNSILESIAKGPLGFKQGRHATCTVSSEFTYTFLNHPEQAIRHLTELALDGETKLKGGSIMKASASPLELEGDSATHFGATLAETLLRNSAMEHALKLSEKNGVTYAYNTQSGRSQAFLDGKLVATFTGLHPEMWVAFHEQMAGCHVSFHSTTNDNGRYSATSGIEYLQESGKPMRVELAYSETGPHNRHYITALGVFTDSNGVERVRFSNNQSEKLEQKFKSVAASHKVEGDGTQSMSVADFERRMLSFAMEQEGLKPGVVQNNFGERNFINQIENARNFGIEPNELRILQDSTEIMEDFKKKIFVGEVSVGKSKIVQESTNLDLQFELSQQEEVTAESDEGGAIQTSDLTLRKKREELFILVS